MTVQTILFACAVLIALCVIIGALGLVASTWKDGSKRAACMMLPIPAAAIGLTLWFILNS